MYVRLMNAPARVVAAPLLARPRVIAVSVGSFDLVAVHWVRDVLHTVTPLALVTQRVLGAKKARVAHRHARPQLGDDELGLAAERAHFDAVGHLEVTALAYAQEGAARWAPTDAARAALTDDLHTAPAVAHRAVGGGRMARQHGKVILGCLGPTDGALEYLRRRG